MNWCFSPLSYTELWKSIFIHFICFSLNKLWYRHCGSDSVVAEHKSAWGKNSEDHPLFNISHENLRAEVFTYVWKAVVDWWVYNFRNECITSRLFNCMKNHTVSGKHAFGIKCVSHFSWQLLFRHFFTPITYSELCLKCMQNMRIFI